MPLAAIFAYNRSEWKSFGFLIIPVKWTAISAFYFTVLVSTVSAIDYFVAFWRQIDSASKDRCKARILKYP